VHVEIGVEQGLAVVGGLGSGELVDPVFEEASELPEHHCAIGASAPTPVTF
jgi:hypothetical protein